jgi:hypothetical protein
MSGELIVTTEEERDGALAPPPSLELAREFARLSKAENTLRGYRSDWRNFCAWCESHVLCPLPANADAVAAYIAECTGHLKVGSIQRRLNAIAEAHKAMRLESPTHTAVVLNTLKGIKRTMGAPRINRRISDDLRLCDYIEGPSLLVLAAKDRFTWM